MSVVADALNTRVRISDPKPAYCSACFQAATADVRFVDFDAAHDGGTFINDQGAVLSSSDDLHLCEPCVKSACEALGLKPQLHGRQSRALRRLEIERDHWRDYAMRVEDAAAHRPQEGSDGE